MEFLDVISWLTNFQEFNVMVAFFVGFIIGVFIEKIDNA